MEAICKEDLIDKEQVKTIQAGKKQADVLKKAFIVAGTPMTRGVEIAMTAERKAAKVAVEEALRALHNRKAVALAIKD